MHIAMRTWQQSAGYHSPEEVWAQWQGVGWKDSFCISSPLETTSSAKILMSSQLSL